jgi:DNA-binding transcriptional LysR family regulator
LSLAQFCQLEQVIVSPDGGGFSAATDTRWRILAWRGGLSFPCHISCLCWRRCAIAIWWRCCRSGWCVGQSGLMVVEPPLAVAGFEMLMLWHERWHRDPAHQWLRQQIVMSLEEKSC